MPRTSRSEARDLLLRSGVAEFREAIHARSADGVLGGLSLERIARRAGYRSVGMIYNLWQDDGQSARAAFFADLLEEIATSYTSVEIELDVELGSDLEQSVRSVALATARYWASAGNDRHVAGRILMASVHIPAVLDVLRATAGETLAEFVSGLDAALELFGFRVKEPLSTVDLAVALRALLLGYLDLADIHPAEAGAFHEQSFEWRGSSEWTTFAVASLGVVMEMVEAR